MIILLPMGSRNYLLRDIDEDLWRAVKVRAAEVGLPIRTVILSLLRKWAAKHGKSAA